VAYAGWWRRVAAYLLDQLILYGFLVPGFVVLAVGPSELERCEDFNGFEGTCEVPTASTLTIGLVLIGVAVLVYIVIYFKMLGRGATWGRKALGYRILDARTLQPIGTGRSVGRYFASILSALPCYLGFLWPLWDGENRTFQDMIVKTRAIKG
jgi:uncharacterized RDD family membrane protein YckC